MIDEARTFEEFGYTSDELTPGSARMVIAICNHCLIIRPVRFSSYVKTDGDCNSCTRIGKIFSDEHKHNMSIALSGKNHPNFGKHRSDETKQRISIAQCGCKNHNYNKTASDESRRKMSESRRGENNSMWNPNLTDEDRMHNRKSNAHYEWALNVKKRDNFTCQKCGIGINLVSHHLLGYTAHINSRFDLDNGATLCDKCHKEFHHLYGYKHFTDKNFFVWVISNE